MADDGLTAYKEFRKIYKGWKRLDDELTASPSLWTSILNSVVSGRVESMEQRRKCFRSKENVAVLALQFCKRRLKEGYRQRNFEVCAKFAGVASNAQRFLAFCETETISERSDRSERSKRKHEPENFVRRKKKQKLTHLDEVEQEEVLNKVENNTTGPMISESAQDKLSPGKFTEVRSEKTLLPVSPDCKLTSSEDDTPEMGLETYKKVGPFICTLAQLYEKTGEPLPESFVDVGNHIEFFHVGPLEKKTRMERTGRCNSCMVGQVAIRCGFCANQVPLGWRKSFSIPGSMEKAKNSVAAMLYTHWKHKLCELAPKALVKDSTRQLHLIEDVDKRAATYGMKDITFSNGKYSGIGYEPEQL